MNVEARLLCLFSEPMTLEQTVVLWRDATACARQVQKMMELVIWNLTMGIGCTSLKLIPSVIIGFKVFPTQNLLTFISISYLKNIRSHLLWKHYGRKWMVGLGS